MSDLPLFNWIETDGYVNRPASRERAIREASDGTRNARHRKVMKHLEWYGVGGATWKELGDELHLHHGQISGALSKLHEKGEVFTLREKRDRCHPYVHKTFRKHFLDEEVYDEPAKTASQRKTDLLDEVSTALRTAIANQDWLLVAECVQNIEKEEQ